MFLSREFVDVDIENVQDVSRRGAFEAAVVVACLVTPACLEPRNARLVTAVIPQAINSRYFITIPNLLSAPFFTCSQYF
jgi:hypothetical protein